MNKARKRPMLHKVLSMILALVMVLSLMPVSALAATDTASGSTDFMRIFHLDCGRKYFTVDQIKELIDCAAENNYTYVELAFGNDGLRFLLDDMDVTVGTKTYDGEEVKTAIKSGNVGYAHAGELTQQEMGRIISYARDKHIGIIPLFDIPGHTTALITAMRELGVNVAQKQIGKNAANTLIYAFDVTNSETVAFTEALVKKYVDYFFNQGCKYFNIGTDECGYGETYFTDANYNALATMIKDMSSYIKSKNMTAMMFNDGFRADKKLHNLLKDNASDIIICYWTYSDYETPNDLAEAGFRIINTNNKWYYAVGGTSEWFSYDWALGNINGQYSDCTTVDNNKNNTYKTDTGCMLAFWYDNPNTTYNDTIKGNIKSLMQALADKNPDYFVAAPVTEITSTADTLSVGGTATLSLSNVPSGESVTWSVDDSSIASLSTNADGSVTVKALKSGTVTVKAITADGTEYNYSLTVQSEDDLESKTITVQVDGEFPETVEGYVGTEGTYTIDEHASYTIKHNTETVSGAPEKANSLESGKYIIGNGTRWIVCSNGTISSTTDPTQATEWTVTKSGNSYTIKDENGYYLVHNSNNNGVSANTSSSNGTWSWSADSGFYYTVTSRGWNGTTTTTTYYLDSYSRGNNYNWSVSSKSNNKNGANPYTVQPATEANTTTITFHGLQAGDSEYVTIGSVRYKVHVTTEDLSNATKLPIQFWITNNIIQFDSTADYTVNKTDGNFGGSNAYYTEIAADKQLDGGDIINSTAGAPLSELIPSYREDLKEWANVYWSPEARKTLNIGDDTWNGRTSQTLVLFQGVLLKNNTQTKLGDDLSNAGDEFRYVRYLNGIWQVSADRSEWVNVGANTARTTGSSNSSGTQVVAYYMIRTKVTKAVTTDVADWGDQQGSPKYTDQVDKDFVLLDFAVKYADSTRDPNTFPQEDKTFAYHCASDSTSNVVAKDSSGNTYRKLNNFRGIETNNYEVYQVTVTMTNDNASTQLTQTTANGGYTYDGQEQIIWAVDEATKEKSKLPDYVSISGENSVYSGCTIGGDPYVRGVEVYNKHGALITYYVRYKATLDSLTVHYVDLTTGNEFHNYNIGVSNEFGEGSMKFKEDIRLNTPWERELINGEVTNDLGVTQIVTADLSKMPDIDPQYRYADYTCVDVKRMDDKSLYLYYTFKTDKTFVVDFGLPLVIRPTDMSAKLSDATITEVMARADADYANVTIGDNDVTYALKRTMDGADKLHLDYTGNIKNDKDELQQGTVNYTVTIIPASTVYYEDSFASFEGGAGTAIGAVWEEVKDRTTQTTTTQALSALGSKDIYGKDEAYADSTMYSMGSAHKVTVNADMVEGWNNDSAWPTATFTFKGTGFDIISLTDNNSGAIYVDVYEGTETTGDPIKSLVVNNYYGYTYDNGTWTATPAADNNALYQIPVMKVSGLECKTYTAVITVAYASRQDKTGDNGYSFWLDAIRVYDPMGKGYEDYTKDNEGYPQYIKLRNELLNSTADIAGSKMLFIDGDSTAKIEVYKNYGPNNEVYLAEDQAISFKIGGNIDIASIQIGAKAPNAVGASMSIQIDNGEAEVTPIGSATEMYYKIDNATDGSTITIANTGSETGSILSLTNLKITYNTDPGDNKVSLEKLSEAEQTQALIAVRALFAAPEPVVEPFAPERFEAKWNSVRAGRQATLTVKTSTDVESISVNGETVDGYRTRCERSGWGPWAQKVEYREFTYTVKATETADYTVCAVNADGVSSESITATLTVKPAQNSWWSNWWDGIFGKWF